jgi:hypothetical protein
LQQVSILGQVAGLSGHQLVVSAVPSDIAFVITGIDMVAAVGVAMAWVLTLGEYGTKFYGNSFLVTDQLKPSPYRGAFVLTPGNTIWCDEAGGSVDIVVWGYIVPYPVPVFP